jgi:hypothetical protein
MATHSGLTRWKVLKPPRFDADEEESKGKKEVFRGNRSIDEDWYKRVVEENLNSRDEEMFIYSVPFEISGYENDTMITSTKAIFVMAEGKKSPVAAVGVQFNYREMHRRFNKTTETCTHANKKHKCTCDSDFVSCFILDNNAYVIFGSGLEYTGRFIGDISPIITHRLIKNGVYKRIRMFDYQAICQKPPEAKGSNASPSNITIFRKVSIDESLPNDHFLILAPREFVASHQLGSGHHFVVDHVCYRRTRLREHQKRDPVVREARD